MATVTKSEFIRVRVTPKTKAAISKKAALLEKRESEIVLRLLEKWIKGDIDI